MTQCITIGSILVKKYDFKIYKQKNTTVFYRFIQLVYDDVVLKFFNFINEDEHSKFWVY